MRYIFLILLSACTVPLQVSKQDEFKMEYNYPIWYEECKKCLIKHKHEIKGDYSRITFLIVPNGVLKDKEGIRIQAGWSKLKSDTTKTIIQIERRAVLNKCVLKHEFIHDLTEKDHGLAFLHCDCYFNKEIYDKEIK